MKRGHEGEPLIQQQFSLRKTEVTPMQFPSSGVVFNAELESQPDLSLSSRRMEELDSQFNVQYKMVHGITS